MASPLTIQASKRPYKKNLVAVGLLLVVIGGYTIFDSNSVSNYNSTFNLLPLRFYKLTDSLKDSATITGHAQTSSGQLISFLIMNSAQFASFQVGQGNASLYSVLNTASASISYTFPSPDTYYLMFLHGSGYLNVTESVAFQRTYFALARFEFFSGILLVAIGVLELYWGLRPHDGRSKAPISQSGTPYGQH